MALSEKVRLIQAAQLVISGKWKLSILIAVNDGISRFRDLQRSLPPITTRSLSGELKEMEASGLVLRSVDDSAPVILVNYGVSDFGKALLPIIEALIEWSRSQIRVEKTNLLENPGG